MREAFHHLRKKYIEAIDGNITLNNATVPIVNRVSTDQAFPYIKIFSYQEEEADQNKTSFVSELVTRFEIVTQFDGDAGGEYHANLIVDGVLDIVRDRTNVDLSADNFNVYYTNIDRVRYFEEYEDGKTYFRALIDVTNKVEKI